MLGDEFNRLRPDSFEEPAIVVTPALTEDTYIHRSAEKYNEPSRQRVAGYLKQQGTKKTSENLPWEIKTFTIARTNTGLTQEEYLRY